MNSKRNFEFKNTVSREVLCNYLSRAVTLSSHREPMMYGITPHKKQLILNTGAKYIQRAETTWNPTIEDYATYDGQKAFIEDVHKEDPDVVFEACVFECVSVDVNKIPVPAWVFKAFNLEPEERNFDYHKMIFPSGKYVDHWCKDRSIPDMTQLETQMFFYFRSCTYISLGFEALHLGQVHLIGEDDTNWECWTKLCRMIREYATQHARRNFVFINTHTRGVVGSDGILLFDFNAYPARPMADGSQEPHYPTEDNPQRCLFTNRQRGDFKSIYGKSIGGKTYSGWECDTLPYLIELDEFGDVEEQLNINDPEDVRCWGMDEINWFANQPAWYRAEFLRYAYKWMREEAEGEGFMALPAERRAFYYDENKNITRGVYYAYLEENFPKGNNDELVIKEIFDAN